MPGAEGSSVILEAKRARNGPFNASVKGNVGRHRIRAPKLSLGGHVQPLELDLGWNFFWQRGTKHSLMPLASWQGSQGVLLLAGLIFRFIP